MISLCIFWLICTGVLSMQICVMHICKYEMHAYMCMYECGSPRLASKVFMPYSLGQGISFKPGGQSIYSLDM